MSFDDGLLALWEFEADSGDFIDLAGSNDLTRQGTEVVSVTGKINQAADFTGTQTAASVTSDLGISGIDNLTISAWIRPLSVISGNKRIWYLFDGSGAAIRLSFGTTQRPFVQQFGPSTVTVVAGVDDVVITDAWNHIVYVYERGVFATLYLNGVQVAQEVAPDDPTPVVSVPTWVVASDLNFTTGRTEAYQDQIAVWNRALSAGEITLLAAGISIQNFEVSLPVLKTLLQSLLLTLDDIGNVWTYEPHILEPSQLETFFFSDGAVRAWTIMRDAVQEQDETNCEVLREHRVIVRGYLTFNPGIMSDTIFEELIEDVLRVIRDNPSLNGFLEHMFPGSTTPTRFRLLAQSEPVHFVEIIVRMQHVVDRLIQ